MSVTTPVLRAALGWLLPSPCVGCGVRVPDDARFGLCSACRSEADRLWRPGRGPACRTCARPLRAAAVPDGFRCGRCRHRPPALVAVRVGWSFEPPVTEVVRGFKFRRLDFLGDELGAELGEMLAAEIEPEPADLVIPMPLPWTRRLRRGFNPAEVLARPIARQLGLPLETPLTRMPGRRQTGLTRAARRRNLEGRLRCRRSFAGERVLLVDDVLTTGVSLDAAARCLLRAGAGSVSAVVAARTPGPMDDR